MSKTRDPKAVGGRPEKRSVARKTLHGGAIQSLAGWFGRQKRVLPWRDRPTLYRVWISEIMLQQTQVVTVVPYFEKFMARFPDVETLARAPLEDVLEHWAGLGYYSRARNVHRAAALLVEHGFPRTREGWLEIPGVGPYTAGAICSIALGLPEPLLDGNVERVFSRLRRMRQEKAPAKARMWRLARTAVNAAAGLGVSPSDFNQALMELGAIVCTPRSPKCGVCPVASVCRARAAGEQEQYPLKKRAKEWLDVREELHCWIASDGRLLLHKRAAGEWRAGLWDFGGASPEGRAPGFVKVGEVETRYVVTRHKVRRITHVWRDSGAISGKRERARRSSEANLLRAADPAPGNTEAAWLHPDAVATGSPFKRTLREISERFPEAWPAD